MRRRNLAMTAALLLSLSMLMAAQNVNQLYERGMFKEARGDLKGAIQDFENLVMRFPSSEPFVAKSLLQLGGWYELLDDGQADKARNAYQRVIAANKDRASVAEATARLAALSANVTDRFVWVNMDGTESAVALEPGSYQSPDLSPDGRRLAFAAAAKPSVDLDIWILELNTKKLTRLTSDPARETIPLWSPDSRSVVYYSKRNNVPGLYRKSADGLGREELVTAPGELVAPTHWTSDGRFIICFKPAGVKGSDLKILAMDTLTYSPLLAQPGIGEADGTVSPDGRWLAYAATDTGRWEIYLTTFPNPTGKWRITSEGAGHTRWSPARNELFYVSAENHELMSVEIGATQNGPLIGKPRRVHAGPVKSNTAGHSFALTPDGQRLIVWLSPDLKKVLP